MHGGICPLSHASVWPGAYQTPLTRGGGGLVSNRSVGTIDESNSLLDTVLLRLVRAPDETSCRPKCSSRTVGPLGCRSVNYSSRATTLVSLVSVSDGKWTSGFPIHEEGKLTFRFNLQNKQNRAVIPCVSSSVRSVCGVEVRVITVCRGPLGTVQICDIWILVTIVLVC
jgi:hypothetical protein